jgi:hypothetical protein
MRLNTAFLSSCTAIALEAIKAWSAVLRQSRRQSKRHLACRHKFDVSDRLPAEQAVLLISPETAETTQRTKKRAAGGSRADLATRYLEGLLERLNQLESRDEGENLLLKTALNKRDLEQMARMMDLPVLRDDDANRLRQKIVESSIGGRLNSRVIRGQ